MNRTVVALGAVSLLTDAASEMVIPLLPTFLVTVLGGSALAIGWIEGVADAVSSVLKLLSGRWSDRSGRRRPYMLAGYAISSLVRPLVAVAGAVWHVLAVRICDRIGKGLRSAPRDALLAASVPAGERGAAFSFHRAMDNTGAIVGPLIAAGFLYFVSSDLRLLFALALIPGLLSLVVLTRIAERPVPPPPPAPPPLAPLRGFLVPLGLFTLGNASDVFLLLKAGAVATPVAALPLLWMGFHIVKVAAALPGGILADRWGRRQTLAIGWLARAACFVAFAFAEGQAAVWGIFLAYGCYHGLAEGSERALVADLAPRGRAGTAFGWYHLTLGAFALAASLLFGALWDARGSATAFLTSAGLALAAVGALLWRTRREPPPSSTHQGET